MHHFYIYEDTKQYISECKKIKINQMLNYHKISSQTQLIEHKYIFERQKIAVP